MKKPTTGKPRNPSYDELKAAEAAFQGRPFNQTWSEQARVVYDGILAATLKLGSPLGYGTLPAEPDFDDCDVPVGALADADGDDED
jgi:hypothetical protein